MSALMLLKGDQDTDMHMEGCHVMIKLDTETLHLQVNTTKERFSCYLAEYRAVVQIHSFSLSMKGTHLNFCPLHRDNTLLSSPVCGLILILATGMTL